MLKYNHAIDKSDFTVALTGASGAVLCREALVALEADERVAHIHFVASAASRRVAAEELGLELAEAAGGLTNQRLLAALLGGAPGKTTAYEDDDLGAGIASGSYPSDGMIVLPCSMGTLAKIANGLADSLIGRAADVALKERRPLILAVRETPFNRIHLRNMTLAAEAGATIFPVIPAFYFRAEDTGQMARQFVCRLLAYVGLPQPGAAVWEPGA